MFVTFSEVKVVSSIVQLFLTFWKVKAVKVGLKGRRPKEQPHKQQKTAAHET